MPTFKLCLMFNRDEYELVLFIDTPSGVWERDMLMNNNEDTLRPEYSAELIKSGTRGKYAKPRTLG